MVGAMAGEKQESGASSPLGLSPLGTASEHRFFSSYRVCGLWLQKNDSYHVPGGLHSGPRGTCGGGLRPSALALAPDGGLPAHLLLLAVLLVTHPLPDTRTVSVCRTRLWGHGGLS